MRITALTYVVIAVTAACSPARQTPPPPAAASAPAIAPVLVAIPQVPAGPPVDPDLYGTFRMTRYYVAQESEYKAPAPAPAPAPSADVVLASAAPIEAAPTPVAGITIYDDRGCREIATLSKRFYEVLDVQGTGKLRDGRVVNVSEACGCGTSPCYRVCPPSSPWGRSAISTPLQPFRTIAVDPKVIPLNSLVYIAELDGITMPGQAPWGGFVHDGCVIAADVGGGIEGKEIDFFVGRFHFKKMLDAQRKMKKVTAYDGSKRCEKRGPHVARRAGI